MPVGLPQFPAILRSPDAFAVAVGLIKTNSGSGAAVVEAIDQRLGEIVPFVIFEADQLERSGAKRKLNIAANFVLRAVFVGTHLACADRTNDGNADFRLPAIIEIFCIIQVEVGLYAAAEIVGEGGSQLGFVRFAGEDRILRFDQFPSPIGDCYGAVGAEAIVGIGQRDGVIQFAGLAGDRDFAAEEFSRRVVRPEAGRPAELAGSRIAFVNDIGDHPGQPGNIERVAVDQLDTHDVACRDATKLVRYAVRFAGQALTVHNDVLRCLAETSLALIIAARYYEARNTRNHVERIARGELCEICRIEGPRGAARSVRDRRRILCRSRILGEGGRCDAAGDDDGGSSKQQSVQTHEDCPIPLKLDFAFTSVGETAYAGSTDVV